MPQSDLTINIKAQGKALGFFRVGVARAERLDSRHLDAWLNHGYHGQMGYMKQRRDLRLDPSTLLPNVQSIIVCAMNYYTPFESAVRSDEGRISRYAWGDDYHDVMRGRLKELLSFIQKKRPEAKGRVFADSAPVMEKEWAVRAGIGWQGKHSNVITRECGSWFFLGVVLLDIVLDYDQPFHTDYCGTCTKCMDACPTGAIVRPGVVNAEKCISYLTIELKPDQRIPEKLKSKMGNHIFGCDICQEVCPYNKKQARPTDEPAFQPRVLNLNMKLSDIMAMSNEEFKKKFHNSPVKRSKLEGLKRNAKAVFENGQKKSESNNL